MSTEQPPEQPGQSASVVQGFAHEPLQRLTRPEPQQTPLLQLPEQQSLFPLQVTPLGVQQELFWQIWPDEQMWPHLPQLLVVFRSVQVPWQQPPLQH